MSSQQEKGTAWGFIRFCSIQNNQQFVLQREAWPEMGRKYCSTSSGVEGFLHYSRPGLICLRSSFSPLLSVTTDHPEEPRLTKCTLQNRDFIQGMSTKCRGAGSASPSQGFGAGPAIGNTTKSPALTQADFSKDLPGNFRLHHPLLSTLGSELIKFSHQIKLQHTHLVWQLWGSATSSKIPPHLLLVQLSCFISIPFPGTLSNRLLQ